MEYNQGIKNRMKERDLQLGQEIDTDVEDNYPPEIKDQKMLDEDAVSVNPRSPDALESKSNDENASVSSRLRKRKRSTDDSTQSSSRPKLD